jgi:RNA polymerase sigma factor (sigma-70 family)
LRLDRVTIGESSSAEQVARSWEKSTVAQWEQTFTALVHERGPALLRYAFFLTGSKAEAEDVMQDALVTTFARGRASRDLEFAEAYVRRAILNRSIDGHRTRQRWAGVSHLFARPEALDGPADGIGDQLDVIAALQLLPPRERACAVLRFYEDLTVPQIARQLDCSEGAVKRYLSDARKGLEARLGPVATNDHPAETVTIDRSAR